MMRRCFAAMAAALFTLAAPLYAADAAPKATPRDAFKTKTKSVAIFKDGYGFFMREGKAYLRDGWCMTDYIPKATAGTFWFYTSEPNTAVTAVRSTGKNEVRFENVGQLVLALQGKIGLQVRIQTEDVTIEGELNRVLEDMLLVKCGKEMRVVQNADVKSVYIVGQPLLIKVQTEGKTDQVTMNMGYLQAGINWVPSYTAEFISSSKLRLNLRTTITNGVEDLRDCVIYLVVGVPNFMLKGQLDPLTAYALGTSVLSAMPGAAPAMAQTFRNAAAERDEAGDGTRADLPQVNLPVEGLKELYFYELKGIDVSAGDVLMANALCGDIDYRSVFVWNADAGQDIYHWIILKNTLASPLTTGPVMVLDQGRPISQDQINYTSIGGECRVKLTLSGDVRGEQVEKEAERKPQEKIWDVIYIPVVSEGRMTVFNRKNEAIQVEVSRNVPGKVLETSDDGQAKSQTSAEDGLNPQSSIKWTIRVEPGKDRAVTYKYLRYVRARTS